MSFSIADLFKEYDESGFREREQKCLQQVIKQKQTAIVACGGGTPCHLDNMALMKGNGTVVYIKANTTQLVANIGRSKEVRPLLEGQNNLGEYLDNLLAQRYVYYEQADHILPANDISLATFDQIISSCINRQ